MGSRGGSSGGSGVNTADKRNRDGSKSGLGWNDHDAFAGSLIGGAIGSRFGAWGAAGGGYAGNYVGGYARSGTVGMGEAVGRGGFRGDLSGLR